MESKAINRYTNHRHIANKTDSVFVRNRIKVTVRSPRNLRAVVCTRPVTGSLFSSTNTLLCDAAGAKNSFSLR